MLNDSLLFSILSLAQQVNELTIKIATLNNTIKYAPDWIYWKDKNSIHLGCDDQFAIAAGYKHPEEMIGKTDYDLPWSNRADKYIDDDQDVIITGNPKLNIEDIVSIKNGSLVTVISNKVPLRDSTGQVIGILGIATDITHRKQLEYELRRSRIIAEEFQMLNNLIKYAPGMIYWKDKNSIHLGCNDQFAIAAGYENREEIIGRSDLDFPWHEQAIKYNLDDKEVIKSGKPRLNIEDIMLCKNGKNVIVLTNKVPLRDIKGDVMGVLGIATDITYQKQIAQELKNSKEAAESALQSLKQAQLEQQKQRAQAERLEQENATHKVTLELQAQRARMTDQVFHDINSPLTTLKTLEVHLSKLPEMTDAGEKRIPEVFRTGLRNSIRRIADTIHNLLKSARVQNQDNINEKEDKKIVLLSAALLESLSEKRFEYENKPVQFIAEFEPNSQFSFINIPASQLSRSLSNLMNNSVQSFQGKPGTLTLKLHSDKEYAHITIEDNGKGMPPEMIDRILNKIPFTEGKKEGHGIGLGQVHDTLERHFGNMKIKSALGHGTLITLSFPKHPPPSWCIDTLQITQNDIIVILDDDPSIHGAWDLQFKHIVEEEPSIQLYHFETAQAAIEYIQSLNVADKEKLLLLTDFELLNQPFDGLEVIQAVQIKRAILVTSHYLEPDIQGKIVSLSAKLLPKQLASEIPIIYNKQSLHTIEQFKIVDAVWLEDNQGLIDAESLSFTKNDKVDIYKNPQELLRSISIYPRHTPIFLDNNFDPPFNVITGLEIAAKLHLEFGFTRLFLTSGQNFSADEVPAYLTVIPKWGPLNLKKYW